jgi:hypothetical protein
MFNLVVTGRSIRPTTPGFQATKIYRNGVTVVVVVVVVVLLLSVR